MILPIVNCGSKRIFYIIDAIFIFFFQLGLLEESFASSKVISEYRLRKRCSGHAQFWVLCCLNARKLKRGNPQALFGQSTPPLFCWTPHSSTDTWGWAFGLWWLATGSVEKKKRAENLWKISLSNHSKGAKRPQGEQGLCVGGWRMGGLDLLPWHWAPRTPEVDDTVPWTP